MQKELDSPQDLSVPWRLPADPASVTLARHATRRHLTAVGVKNPDLIDTAELLVSELTSNVVKHTGGRPTLRVVQRGDLIRIEVSDDRPSEIPVEQDMDIDAESGRGLLLVSSLATSWGYERDGAEKRTWVELASTGDHG
ncbi:MAG: ATP-binding protein [Actinomycetia bacterium]|nr:ATP-binding protein [Actinomycetes bacterium]